MLIPLEEIAKHVGTTVANLMNFGDFSSSVVDKHTARYLLEHFGVVDAEATAFIESVWVQPRKQKTKALSKNWKKRAQKAYAAAQEPVQPTTYHPFTLPFRVPISPEDKQYYTAETFAKTAQEEREACLHNAQESEELAIDFENDAERCARQGDYFGAGMALHGAKRWRAEATHLKRSARRNAASNVKRSKFFRSLPKWTPGKAKSFYSGFVGCSDQEHALLLRAQYDEIAAKHISAKCRIYFDMLCLIALEIDNNEVRGASIQAVVELATHFTQELGNLAGNEGNIKQLQAIAEYSLRWPVIYSPLGSVSDEPKQLACKLRLGAKLRPSLAGNPKWDHKHLLTRLALEVFGYLDEMHRNSEDWCSARPELAYIKDAAKLPELDKNTAEQWWPIAKAVVTRSFGEPHSDPFLRSLIKAAADTDKILNNKFWYRLRRSFLAIAASIS
jgi:hypothetical protein